MRVRALARNSDVAEHPLIRERYPVLSQALLAGASPQLRNTAVVAWPTSFRMSPAARLVLPLSLYQNQQPKRSHGHRRISSLCSHRFQLKLLATSTIPRRLIAHWASVKTLADGHETSKSWAAVVRE